MTAPLSIVIPTLNAAPTVALLMQDLMAGVIDGLVAEVILADGGSTDTIADLAEASGARLLTASKGRGSQIAAGIAAARAEWCLILHADSALPQDWPHVVRAHLDTGSGRAASFRLSFDSKHPMAFVTAAWANLRTRAFGLPYGDQGLLISKELCAAVGGYPDLPLMEDVAMARRLKGRLDLLDARIVTGAGRYRSRGWFRHGGSNLLRLARYMAGADPAMLARGYGVRASSNCKR